MKSFFMDGEQLSMMRLLSFMTCIVGLAIGLIATLKGSVNAETVGISMGFVTAGITGKLIQKGQE